MWCWPEASELGLRTEEFVNQRYKLSYLGRRGTAVSPPVEPDDGDRYLVVRAHREGLDTKEKFPLTYYVPAQHFELAARPAAFVPSGGVEPAKLPVRPEVGRRWLMLGLIGGLVAAGFAIVVLKHSSLIHASERLDELQWDRDDWIVPSIQLRSKSAICAMSR